MKNFIPLFLFFILITTGCYSIETVESTTVPANDIYQSYFVRMDKDRTYVSATFRVGVKSGATIDLDAPSKIEHNGKLMAEMAPTGWKGTTYEESNNKFIGNHQFIYTDAGGKTFRNEINFVPLEFINNAFQLSRSNKMIIPLSRTATENENVSITLSGRAKSGRIKSNETSNDSVTLRLAPSRAAVIIEPDDLKNLADGRANLSLRVEAAIPLKQTTAKGGELSLSYEAREAVITIVK